MRKGYKKLLATGLSAVVALSGISVLPASNPSEAAEEGYNLYFGIQTNASWVFRNQWNAGVDGYGGGSEAFEGGLYDTEDVKWEKVASGDGYEWKLAPEDNTGAGPVPALITDALNIDLSGEEQTYTIKCEADPSVGYLDWGDTGATHEYAELNKNPNAFNTVFVSSNIPYELVEVVDCKLYFDGVLINDHDGARLWDLQDSLEFGVDLINAWNTNLTANDTYVDLPKESIVIEITIKGNGAVAPTSAPGGDDGKATPAPGGDDGNATPAPGGNGNTTETPSPDPNATLTVVGLAKNKTFTSGNFKYKVTTASVKTGTKTTAGKVSVVGLTGKGKKAKALSVPATVSNSGAKYAVSAIAANGAKGAKATSVTLGKNVKSIAKGAFANCKKLSKLSVKAKLSSVAKNAFKGCKKTIKVSGASKKANVKKLKKSGYKKFK